MWRGLITAALAFTAVLSASSAANSTTCGAQCTVKSTGRSTSILPKDIFDFITLGRYATDTTQIIMAGDETARFTLPFSVTIDNVSTNTIAVTNNGAVGFAPLDDFNGQSAGPTDFGLIDGSSFVAAPFFANLQVPESSDTSDSTDPGVYYQTGYVDLFADANNEFSLNDALPAAVITWFDMLDGDSEVYAQLQITDLGNGNFRMDYYWGNPDDFPNAVQPGLGSFAGFSLGSNFAEFTGPYSNDGSPNFYALVDGKLVIVPEPGTWSLFILAFAALGFARRWQLGRRLAG